MTSKNDCASLKIATLCSIKLGLGGMGSAFRNYFTSLTRTSVKRPRVHFVHFVNISNALKVGFVADSEISRESDWENLQNFSDWFEERGAIGSIGRISFGAYFFCRRTVIRVSGRLFGEVLPLPRRRE
jgi:hypothetical protein